MLDADLQVFSDTDQDALDRVYEAFGQMSAKELSELSHQFPEWTFYQDLLDDKEKKNSYRIDLSHFFEKGPRDDFFNESDEMLRLTQDLHQQYSHN